MEPYKHNKRDGYTLVFAFFPVLFASLFVATHTDFFKEMKSIIATIISVSIFFIIQSLVGQYLGRIK